MKRISIFILICLIPIISSAQWIDISPEIDVWLHDVYSPSEETIVVVGKQGTILKSTDGGESWEQKDSGTTNSLYTIEFISAEIGFVLGDVILLKTIDGGETWNEINTNYNGFRDFTVLDENNIYILGFQILIYTTDGGETWNVITNSPPSHTELHFFDDGIGFAGDYRLYKTTDNGSSWDEFYNPNSQEYEGAPSSFLNASTGFIYWHGLTKFTDDGQLWLGANPDFPELLDLFSINENRSWGIIKGLSEFAPPSRGIVKISIEGETTSSYSDEVMWLPEGVTLQSIKFFNGTGYVVGSHGKALVWKNEAGGNYMRVSEIISNQIANIYPNPASEEINIDFNVDNLEEVRITLTDLTGKTIFHDKFNNQPKIKIITSHFPKGAYILSIKTKQKNFSQRILIK